MLSLKLFLILLLRSRLTTNSIISKTRWNNIERNASRFDMSFHSARSNNIGTPNSINVRGLHFNEFLGKRHPDRWNNRQRMQLVIAEKDLTQPILKAKK